MMLSRDQLLRAAADSGFPAESYEKAHALVRLLDGVRAHPFLAPRMALKGGTALNLFLFDLPRLSADIDLNYIGASDRETMLAERPRLEQGLQQVAGRLGFTVKRAPGEHAGGKWRLTYTTALGRQGSVEIDVNFLLRTPLWPVAPRDSHPIGGEQATQVLVVDDHELAAGKLAALVARNASRDVFDARELLGRPGLDRARLRFGFVVYGAMNRTDWRTITVEHVRTTPGEVDTQLVPMLRSNVRPAKREIRAWTEKLVRETRELMAAVLPLEAHELEFIERVNGAGEIVPELVTAEPVMQAILRVHPGLQWKALNTKRRIGVAGDDAPTE
jgi:predicted nucleotidyltransferase component of viral defense system